MPVFNDILLWLHLMALALGVAGGVGLGQVGQKLVAAGPEQRATYWPLMAIFDRFALGGLVLLLITGPLLLAFKYHGQALSPWFMAKMGLVVLFLILVGLSHMGKARLKRGDEGGAKLMMVTGPLTMLTVLGIVLTAVLAFN